MTAGEESVEDFRARARAWIRTNVPERHPRDHVGLLRPKWSDEEELAEVTAERALQRQFHDAGLAGVCFPRQYGGLGLTVAHQQALREELRGYDYPARIQLPTFSPCAAVLLEFGTEEQKRQHIPAILRGEEIWMQLLSEPSGGSDVAGARTTAIRDGDEWILNGSKVWTTGAWWSDWGLCLARTNWDVPKHRGLTVFILPLHQEGVEVHRIEMLNGFKDFCQEFMSDVRVPDSDRVGEVDAGWTIGTRWLFHERMLANSPYVSMPAGDIRHSMTGAHNLAVARASGTIDNPIALDLIGESRMLELVTAALQQRIRDGVTTGAMSDQSASVAQLHTGLATVRMTSITYELAGAAGTAWDDADGMAAEWGNDYLMRQVSTIGGGTTEMARNGIAERVLGMPREWSHDRDLPFREVPKGPSENRR
jgi:alkylation response protein AidB-like acyl-CoA dehydrogenase